MEYRLETKIGELVITRATAEETEEILNLWVDASRWIIESTGIHQWRLDALTIDYVKKRCEVSEVFVAKLHDEMIAAWSVQWSDERIWKELHNHDSGYIHKLAVLRKYKGHELGKKLLEWSEQYIKTKGKNYIRLDCRADNSGLNSFYEGLGFTRIGVSGNSSFFEKAL